MALHGGVPPFLDPGKVYCHEVIGEWEEDAATWNNTNHLIGEEVWANDNFGAFGTNWYSWIITDLVREWAEYPDQNYGVAVFPRYEDGGLIAGEIKSSEFPYWEGVPQLEIHYVIE